jgi:hypothetical protein
MGAISTYQSHPGRLSAITSSGKPMARNRHAIHGAKKKLTRIGWYYSRRSASK